jgi:hypothetical protein
MPGISSNGTSDVHVFLAAILRFMLNNRTSLVL